MILQKTKVNKKLGNMHQVCINVEENVHNTLKNRKDRS